MDFPENVMTLEEVSKYLKLTEDDLLKLVKNHKIPCAKVAGQWRFLKPMVDDWLTSQMNVIPHNDLSRLIQLEYQYVPISRLMDENLIIFDIDNCSKKEILSKLVSLAKNNNLISEEAEILEKLLEREALMSTGLGKGIALPHLRKPSNQVTGPKILIAVSNNGVDFESLDGSPTHLIFLILTDSETVHLRVMAKLSGIIREPHVVERLKVTTRPREVLQFFLNYEINK